MMSLSCFETLRNIGTTFEEARARASRRKKSIVLSCAVAGISDISIRLRQWRASLSPCQPDNRNVPREAKIAQRANEPGEPTEKCSAKRHPANIYRNEQTIYVLARLTLPTWCTATFPSLSLFLSLVEFRNSTYRVEREVCP